MPIVNQHFRPEHGLQIEETHEAGDQNGVYHLFRYWYAWAYLEHCLPRGVHVQDWGCGCGSGSRIMAERHSGWHLDGFDNDIEAIEYGGREYTDLPNVRFHQVDLDSLWFTPKALFGHHPKLIVCFDVMDFLANRDLFLLRLARECRGMHAHVLFSAPEKSSYASLKPRWGEKRVEFSTGLCAELLRLHFSTVVHSGQADFPLAGYVKEISDYAGYPVGEDIIVCKDLRK